MTPTLAGRLQTRLALGLLVGLPLTLLATLLLGGLDLGDALRGLAVIVVLGLGWDLLHQAVQERRWDRDWPRLLTLLSWLPEASASWLALHAIDSAVSLGTHLAFFSLVWGGLLAARAVLLPVLLPRWRHQGQRLTGVLPAAGPATAGTPADERAPRRLDLGAAFPGLRAGHRQFATLALLVGVFGSIVFLAPLFDRESGTSAAEPRPATGAGDAMAREMARRDATDGNWNTHHRIRPAYVEFPAARVSTRLGRTRVNDAGVLVTPDPDKAAWYSQGAAPGQSGPAVLIGSVDTVFAGLDRAAPGQSVRVVRTDGSQVYFTVDRVAEVDARSFPTKKVYGAAEEPLLRLVGYDDSSGRNTIVFARAVMMVQSPTAG